jgi:Flp pilus assembly protein TadD
MHTAFAADGTAVDALTEARRHFEQNRGQQCLSALREAGDDALDQADFWFMRAESLRQLGRLKDAVKAARVGLERWPEHIGLLDTLGLALLSSKKVAAAEENFRSALQLAPDTPVLLAHHGIALRRLGRVDEATRVYNGLLALDADSPSANRARATLAVELRDPNADRHIADVLALDPEDPTGHLLRGRLALRQRRSGDASAAFREAAALSPGSVGAAKAARWAQVLDHPLLFPSRWILMLGSGRARILYFAVWITLVALHLRLLAWTWFAFWVVFVLVVPRLLRSNLARRHGSL